jgi:hypothetical protein
MNEERRKQIVEVAQDLLSGRISLIEGARGLSRTRPCSTSENDPDLLLFVQIDMQTQDIPIGPIRKEWDADALKKKDLEIQKHEALFRESATAAAQRIVKRYGLGT